MCRRINKKTAIERKFVESEKRRRHEFLTGCENKAGDYPWPIYRKGPSLFCLSRSIEKSSLVCDVQCGKRCSGAEVYFVIAQRACCVNSCRLCHRPVYIHDFLARLFVEILERSQLWRGGLHLVNSWLHQKEVSARSSGLQLCFGRRIKFAQGSNRLQKGKHTLCVLLAPDKLTDAKWVYWISLGVPMQRGGMYVRVWMRPQGGFFLILWGNMCLFWLERWKWAH